MREWLSGGAPPCQGGGRGFDPRLALGKKNDTKSVSFFFSSPGRARKFDIYAPLRSAQSEVPRTSCAVSRLSARKISKAKGTAYLFRFV